MDNQKLINSLNQLLSNYFVMYVKLHRYHWFIQGRHFFQLHNVFEDMYNTMAEDLDEIAERVLMIDGKPLATMTKYMKETTLVEATADDKEDEITAQLVEDYRQMITEIKEEGIPLADDLHDEPTVDLLVTLQSKLEKYIWMLHAYRAYE
ncbi:MAG TPA: DNA starvation/stationary phase protection protein [Lentibacillus sp.]|uniref:Dps family protein n=1 Tax=Lentibacillus sp. TaxID=1925746 RepID=UPI002B4B43BA|nr:DNA starvation/stationary phase protection protein [Lentibacillus sp.]HLR63048.1 DNA starvation/stationary phase protection protein [Lentibacillus sp.]